MNKNKSLLAIALAVAALGCVSSTMALTFTDGNFTGGVDISGTVTVPVAVNHWQWAAGDAISFPSHPVTQMTNSYKTLTLSAPSNLPLLVGQTTAATVGNPGNVGINPQIEFTDAAGTAVIPVWHNTGNTGKGTITLPVTAADGTTALGSMTLEVKVGALKAHHPGNGSGTFLDTVYSPATGPSLYGQTAIPSQAAGIMATYAATATWTTLLGSKTESDLRQQLNDATGSNATTWTLGTQQPATFFSDPGDHFSGAYGLGIAQGDPIVVSFTNQVTANTTWKAPLKMTVTYL